MNAETLLNTLDRILTTIRLESTKEEVLMVVQSLQEVRSNIDRIDGEIIRLMAERETYVLQAARFKTSPAQVDAPDRVEDVAAKVRSLAEKSGLDPDIAEATYRPMMAAYIKAEHQAFNKLQKADG